MLLNFFFAVTNKKPSHVSITKVKQFPGSSSFAKRSMWTIDQLRQVNGCDPNRVSLQYTELLSPGIHFSWPHDLTVSAGQIPNHPLETGSCVQSFSISLCFYHSVSFSKDCPEFDLAFDNAFDQWVAGSAGEKCTFIQILHHTCQRYSSQSKPEFVNCQPKLLGGKRHTVTRHTISLSCSLSLSLSVWKCQS